MNEDQPHGYRPENLPAAYDGAVLTIGDRRIELTPDEANAAKHAIVDWNIAQTKAWEDERRAAGQVWIANYMRHHSECEEECFSLDDALGFLWYGSEMGNLAIGSIKMPDGSIMESDAIWETMLARDAAGVSR